MLRCMTVVQDGDRTIDEVTADVITSIEKEGGTVVGFQDVVTSNGQALLKGEGFC